MKSNDQLVNMEAAYAALSARAERGAEIDDLMCRRAYLDSVNRRVAIATRTLTPKVFVSYAGFRGEEMFKTAHRLLRGESVYPMGPHFEVRSGFIREGEGAVEDQIRSQMQLCCLFLGIMPALMRLDEAERSKEGDSVPGGWVGFEAGIAAGLELPVTFLVEKGVHNEFWKKPVASSRHAVFESARIETGFPTALEILRGHYAKLTRHPFAGGGLR